MKASTSLTSKGRRSSRRISTKQGVSEAPSDKVDSHREKKRLASVHLKVEKGVVVWQDEHGSARYDFRPGATGKEIDEAEQYHAHTANKRQQSFIFAIARRIAMKKSSLPKGRQTSTADRSQSGSRQQQDTSAAAMQTEIEKRSIFPFLELPPELRNMVYEYCIPNNETMRDRDLATLQLPSITRVCRQLRQESMGYMLENRAFELCIGTNMWNRFMYDLWTRRWDQMPDSGTLGLNPTVRSFIKTASTWAIFTDVTMTVYKSQDMPYVRYWCDKSRAPGREEREASMANWVEDARQRKAMVVVHLTTENGNLSIEASHGNIDKIFTVGLAGMKETAEAVGKRKGFKGLTMADLLKIARSLDYNPV